MRLFNRIIIVCILILTSCGGRNKDSEEKIVHPAPPDKEEDYAGVGVREGESTEQEGIVEKPEEIKARVNPPTKTVSEHFKDLKNGVFVVQTWIDEKPYSQGSGFFIAKGIGITNYHVLEGSNRWFIKVSPDNTYRVTKVLASSPPEEFDYVIFKTEVQRNKVLSISKRVPEIGEDVFAIGTPQSLHNSLTKGTISGFRPNQRIQIDATIDHGSSGGPLFNLQGEVIGITTSGVGTGSELNFAVDIQALPYYDFLD